MTNTPDFLPQNISENVTAGLIPAADWCELNEIDEKTTAKVVSLQNRKATTDLQYILDVGEIVVEAKNLFTGAQFVDCCKQVLGIGKTAASAYRNIYQLKQDVPELSQASADALSIRALNAMHSARESYQLKTAEKQAIIAQAEARGRKEGAFTQERVSEKTIRDLKAALGEATRRNAVPEDYEDLKIMVGMLTSEVEELRKQQPKASSEEIGIAAMSPTPKEKQVPAAGSTNDRPTPSISALKNGELGTELALNEVNTVTDWLAKNRKPMLKMMREFQQIADRINKLHADHHYTYELFWHGVDLAWEEMPGKTKWTEAYGDSGDRSKILSDLAMKAGEFAQKVAAVETSTHYRNNPPARVVD